MKRILVVVVVAALALVVMAVPAFAAASPNANCYGEGASTLNAFEPGLGGEVVSTLAQTSGGLGEPASDDCGGY